MTRRGNVNPPTPAATSFTFKPHEYRLLLPRYVPGPSGRMGGYQHNVNHVIDCTDVSTLVCTLDDRHFARLIRDCRRQDQGGPQTRLRGACIPALRRAGIELLAAFA